MPRKQHGSRHRPFCGFVSNNAIMARLSPEDGGRVGNFECTFVPAELPWLALLTEDYCLVPHGLQGLDGLMGTLRMSVRSARWLGTHTEMQEDTLSHRVGRQRVELNRTLLACCACAHASARALRLTVPRAEVGEGAEHKTTTGLSPSENESSRRPPSLLGSHVDWLLSRRSQEGWRALVLCPGLVPGSVRAHQDGEYVSLARACQRKQCGSGADTSALLPAGGIDLQGLEVHSAQASN